MLTKTQQTAQIEIGCQELANILANHFKEQINMTPTSTKVFFESGGYGGGNRDYTNAINVITFIAQKTVNHEPADK